MNLLNKIKLNSKGFGHIEAVLAIVVIGAVGAIGARVMFGSHAQTLSSLGHSTSTAWINNTQFVVAYPTTTNDLKVATFITSSTGSNITSVTKLDLNQSVEPGTRPSITQWGNGYIVAWATNSDTLSLYYNNGAGTTKTYNLNYKMYPGTSPSVSSDSSLNVAYEASNGHLAIIHGYYATAPRDTGLGMYLGSSPSVMGYQQNGVPGYEVAFQSNNGQLWTTGTIETKNWNVSMYPGSSPSIARIGLSSVYEVAYDSTTSTLQTVGGIGSQTLSFMGDNNIPYTVQPGTSPSIGYVTTSSSYPCYSVANNTSWNGDGGGLVSRGFICNNDPKHFYTLESYTNAYPGSSPSSSNGTTAFITANSTLAVNNNGVPQNSEYQTSL